MHGSQGARPAALTWSAYVVVTWLALNTHYFVAFVLVAQNAWFLGQAALGWQPYRRLLKAWIAAQLSVALLYTPWLLLASGIIAGYGGNGDLPGFVEMLRRARGCLPPVRPYRTRSVPGLRLQPARCRYWAPFVWAVPAGPAGPPWSYCCFYLALPLLGTWASALSRPIFNERYLIAAVPPFYLLGGRLRRRSGQVGRRACPHSNATTRSQRSRCPAHHAGCPWRQCSAGCPGRWLARRDCHFSSYMPTPRSAKAGLARTVRYSAQRGGGAARRAGAGSRELSRPDAVVLLPGSGAATDPASGASGLGRRTGPLSRSGPLTACAG